MELFCSSLRGTLFSTIGGFDVAYGLAWLAKSRKSPTAKFVCLVAPFLVERLATDGESISKACYDMVVSGLGYIAKELPNIVTVVEQIASAFEHSKCRIAQSRLARAFHVVVQKHKSKDPIERSLHSLDGIDALPHRLIIRIIPYLVQLGGSDSAAIARELSGSDNEMA